MAAIRPSLLRLRTDAGTTLVPMEQDEPVSTLEILREARRSVLFTYGPCCASSAPLVEAWARRIAETRPMSSGTRQCLLRELASFFRRTDD